MAKKKIFDIAPPEEIKSLPVSPEKKSSPSFKRTIPILIGGAIFLIGISGYIFIEPKAEIELWPQKELIELETKATLSGEIFEAERTVSQEFSATGTKLKEVRARGIIRVYNAYSTLPQPLVANTRFVSDEGKLFRTPKRVVIPGGRYEEGRFVPGEIDIEVVAAEPGEEYNIGPSTFSIPGFAGTARFAAFYAKSFEPMTGGLIAEVPQVTKEDLDRAKEILTAKALEESKLALKRAIPLEEYILVEGALSQEIVEVTPFAEEGQELSSFLFQVRAISQALAFKKSELKILAKDLLQPQIPQLKALHEESLLIDYYPRTFNLKERKVDLDLKISAQIYSVIDEYSLKEMIKNKRPEVARRLLENLPEIDRVEINLWPFWVRSVPSATERINIKLNLD